VTLIFNSEHLKHALFCRTSFTSWRLLGLNFDRLRGVTFTFVILKVLNAGGLPGNASREGALEDMIM
jgi:hypothetical protein